MTRAALVQLTAGEQPDDNCAKTEKFIREAAAGGAEFILTPENTNMITFDRALQAERLHSEADDPTLARLQAVAAELGVWLLIGSLAVKTHDKLANRSFLIGPDGLVVAKYDKIHMFDVELGNGESYRESAIIQAGNQAVLAQTDIGAVGLSVCYDLRFAGLYRQLAQAGAQILTVPAAFTVPTGQAHWEVLLRARAIETGSYLLAPAQTGTHPNGRKTYGHSLAVDPWGKVLADGATTEGVTFVDLDLNQAAEARRRIPSLQHDKDFEPPNVG